MGADDEIAQLQSENYELRLQLFAMQSRQLKEATASEPNVPVDHAILIRSREAIASLEADLASARAECDVALTRTAGLEQALEQCRAQATALPSPESVQQLTAQVDECTARLRDKEAEVETLRASCTDATSECTSLRSKLSELAQDHAAQAARVEALQHEVQAQGKDTAALTTALAEANAKLTVATRRAEAAERSSSIVGKEAQATISGLEDTVAGLHAQLDEAEQMVKEERAQAATMAARVRDYAAVVSDLEQQLQESREETTQCRAQAAANEAHLKAVLGQVLHMVVLKFTAAAHRASLPSSASLLAALQGVPGADADPSGQAVLERSMSALDALPATAEWFGKAAQSLTTQVEERLQACLATVDAFAGRVDQVERGVAGARQLVASAGVTSAAQLPEMAKDLQTTKAQLQAVTGERDQLSQRVSQLERQLSSTHEEVNRLTPLAEQASALATANSHMESSLLQLQQLYEERLAETQGHLSRAESSLQTALSDRRAEVDSLKERLATVLRRLDHARTVQVPGMVKAALTSELERVAVVVRDASSASRVAKTTSDRLLSFLKAGGLSLTTGPTEPAWLAQLRSSLIGQASALSAVADASQHLATRLHHFGHATAMAAQEQAVTSTMGEGGSAAGAAGSGQSRVFTNSRQADRPMSNNPSPVRPLSPPHGLAHPERHGPPASTVGAGDYSNASLLAPGQASVPMPVPWEIPSLPFQVSAMDGHGGGSRAGQPRTDKDGPSRSTSAAPSRSRVLASGMASYVTSQVLGDRPLADTGSGRAESSRVPGMAHQARADHDQAALTMSTGAGAPMYMDQLIDNRSPGSSSGSMAGRGVAQGQPQAQPAVTAAEQLALEVLALKKQLAALQQAGAAGAPATALSPGNGVGQHSQSPQPLPASDSRADTASRSQSPWARAGHTSSGRPEPGHTAAPIPLLRPGGPAPGHATMQAGSASSVSASSGQWPAAGQQVPRSGWPVGDDWAARMASLRSAHRQSFSRLEALGVDRLALQTPSGGEDGHR